MTQGAPAPFVLGAARSGTTLLRLALDSHPLLAIPPETYFGRLARSLGRQATRDQLERALLGQPTFADLGIAPAELARLLGAVEPWTLADGLRAVYRHYAERQGKPRWGDKTPVHTHEIDVLGDLFEEAVFVHVVRDGRDVVASVRGLPFAPAGGAEAAALQWRDAVETARAAGRRSGRYVEVRYEALVSDPERVLRALCESLALPFDAAVLRPHERADARLGELGDVHYADGSVRTRAQRRATVRRTLEPIDAASVGRWRAVLSRDEADAVHAAAGPLLRELGYVA